MLCRQYHLLSLVCYNVLSVGYSLAIITQRRISEVICHWIRHGGMECTVDVVLAGSWDRSMTHSMAWRIITAISSGLCTATQNPRWHTTLMVNWLKLEDDMIQATQEMVKPLSSLTGLKHMYQYLIFFYEKYIYNQNLCIFHLVVIMPCC